jgi:hypothetical protein
VPSNRDTEFFPCGTCTKTEREHTRGDSVTEHRLYAFNSSAGQLDLSTSFETKNKTGFGDTPQDERYGRFPS